MNVQHLFVYGTLKRGGGLNGALGKDAIYVGEDLVLDYTLKRYYINGAIPFMVYEPGSCVYGERWIVTDEDMELVDKIEGSYSKELVVTESGCECYAYIWRRTQLGLIDMGPEYDVEFILTSSPQMITL